MVNMVKAGLGQNTDRQLNIRAGLTKESSAFIVNKVCGSEMNTKTL